MKIKILIGVFFISLLGGCSIFSPVKTECIHEYVVNTVPVSFHRKAMTSKTLLVSLPAASSLYQTKDMAYLINRYQMNYFAKNRWMITPAQMLQPLMIQALQNTHYFKVLAPVAGGGKFDFILNTQLVAFHQIFYAQTSVFKLVLRVQLIKSSTGKALASKEFTVIESAPTRNPYGGVVAANRATAKVLDQLSDWCAKSTE